MKRENDHFLVALHTERVQKFPKRFAIYTFTRFASSSSTSSLTLDAPHGSVSLSVISSVTRRSRLINIAASSPDVRSRRTRSPSPAPPSSVALRYTSSPPSFTPPFIHRTRTADDERRRKLRDKKKKKKTRHHPSRAMESIALSEKLSVWEYGGRDETPGVERGSDPQADHLDPHAGPANVHLLGVQNVVHAPARHQHRPAVGAASSPPTRCVR